MTDWKEGHALADLGACTYGNTRPFVPSFTVCRFLKAYDGDTITVAAVVAGKPYRFSCRLAGIDTAELRTKDPNEKAEAVAARERLLELVGDDRALRVKVQGTDKYGRLLTDVATATCASISATLLREGLAVPYDGGTKATGADFWRQQRARRLAGMTSVLK